MGSEGAIKVDINKIVLQKHEEWQGKLEIAAKSKVNSKEDLSIAYTPGGSRVM